MPKGRGLGIAGELRVNGPLVRPKRQSIIARLYSAHDSPHLRPWMMSRCWKRHRKTQYKQ